MFQLRNPRARHADPLTKITLRQARCLPAGHEHLPRRDLQPVRLRAQVLKRRLITRRAIMIDRHLVTLRGGATRVPARPLAHMAPLEHPHQPLSR